MAAKGVDGGESRTALLEGSTVEKYVLDVVSRLTWETGAGEDGVA